MFENITSILNVTMSFSSNSVHNEYYELIKIMTSRTPCFYTYTFYFLYSYTLSFIDIHPNFYTSTPLLIKVARRHARCTRNKLAVLQHKTFINLLSWSSAFDIYKHDSNRAIFDVGYQAWNENFFKSWDFDVLRKRALRK